MKRLLTFALLAFAPLAAAQNAALMPMPRLTFLDSNGVPLSGGYLYTCVAGTSCTPALPGRPAVNPLATYTDSSAGVANANPIVLDAAGRANVWLGSGTYKIVAQDQFGVTQWSQDNVSSFSLKSVTTSSGAVSNFSVPGALTAKQINNVLMADQYCTTPGTYDQSCLANALAAGPSNARIVLSPHTYTFASKVTVSGLSNVWIEGPGATISANGAAFECDNCTGGGVRDTRFISATTPTVVTKASLPTGNPATPVVIDRWSTGIGYYPTINDPDYAPTAIGGSCVSACLSTQQLNINVTTGVIYRNATGVTVSGLNGTYYYIGFYDSSRCTVANNVVMGGAGPVVSNGGYSDGGGGIYFWQESAGSGGNHDNTITGNVVTYTATSGIMIAGGDHFVVTGNVTNYNGESGFKTYQGSPEQVAYATVTGNLAKYNWYDGFDLGSNFPHSAAFVANSIATGNQSSFNHGVGFYGDGKNWVISGNEATSNGTMGFGLDLVNSVVSSNHSFGNNTVGATWNQIVICPAAIACTGNTVTGNETNTNGIGGSYGLYSTQSTGIQTGNIEVTGQNFFAGAAPHFFNFDSTGPDASTTMIQQQQIYTFAGSQFGGAAWYKLGTWVAGSSTFTPSGPVIELASGAGYNSNSNQQGMSTIFMRTGNNATAPNLSGLTAVSYGSGSGVTALKAAATGGSTAVGNGSWDIYVQQSGSGGGFYTVSVPPGSTWTNSGAGASDPGSASSTVVVGSVYTPVDNTGAANFTAYKVAGTAGVTSSITCTAGQHLTGITITGGVVTGVLGCN